MLKVALILSISSEKTSNGFYVCLQSLILIYNQYTEVLAPARTHNHPATHIHTCARKHHESASTDPGAF